jgi:pimeloyl-ACP methyl ester carboxylesterase
MAIWGSEDAWVKPSLGERLRRDVPRTELILVEGAGHLPMQTHPTAFNAELLAFLAR